MSTSSATERFRDQPDITEALPQLNPWVVLRNVGANDFVIKNQQTSSYFNVGAEEFFLLSSLVVPCTFSQLQEQFLERFGEALQWSDFDDFMKTVTRRGLVPNSSRWSSSQNVPVQNNDFDLDEEQEFNPVSELGRRKAGGSVLFYRVPIYNPDALLNRITGAMPWVWTKSFLVLSLCGMAFALSVMLSNRTELVASFNSAFRLETLFWIWLTTLTVTAFHELAHGATCKRFGGEVREAGVLFLFFMPCLYVNVSDAWLLPERWKRLLITAAGGYLDLCLWALAVFSWRITLPGTLPNYISFVVLTTCGTRGLINFNPLLRLDGYYLLSDFLRIPNLYSNSRKHWMGYLTWALWGGQRPPHIPNGWTLFWYGMISWWFGLVFLNAVSINLLSFASKQFGYAGIIFGVLMFTYALRRVFRGLFGQEFTKMIRARYFRTTGWIMSIAVVAVILYCLPMQYYIVGNFEVRPGDSVDVPAPLNCFIGRVLVNDGQAVSEGDPLVELLAPDLVSEIETKMAELKESEANLAKLLAGPRTEAVLEQESRVKRLKSWRDLGRIELDTTREVLGHQLEALEHRVAQAQTQVRYSKEKFVQSQRLNQQGALADAQLDREKAQLDVLREKLAEAKSEMASKAIDGIRIATAELSRREQELADAESALQLLKLGSRPEEIKAEEARRERIQEELNFLQSQRKGLVVLAPTKGNVSANRLGEKVGRFSPQGTILCLIERPGAPKVEVSVAEDDALSVAIGQLASFKARALPFEHFMGKVERIAPSTAVQIDTPAVQKVVNPRQTVVVHCQVDGAEGKLISGMTGFTRISLGWSTVGKVFITRALRYVRTEFWW